MGLSVFEGLGLSIFTGVDDTPVDGATKKSISSNWAYDHAADIDAHMADLFQDHLLNVYQHCVPYRTYAAFTLTAARYYSLPWRVVRPITVTTLAVQIGTAAAGGKLIRFGLYRDNGSTHPGARVGDESGAIAADATGIKAHTFATPQALVKGLYHCIIVSDGAPIMRGGSIIYSPYGINQTELSDSTQTMYEDAAYAALADPFGLTLDTRTGEACVFAYKASSMD